MEINKPIKKLFDISGRNFVISGSAGMLGKEFYTTMCKAGANVILLDINQKENKKIEKELVKRYNGKTKSYPIDITNKKQKSIISFSIFSTSLLIWKKKT